MTTWRRKVENFEDALNFNDLDRAVNVYYDSDGHIFVFDDNAKFVMGKNVHKIDFLMGNEIEHTTSEKKDWDCYHCGNRYTFSPNVSPIASIEHDGSLDEEYGAEMITAMHKANDPLFFAYLEYVLQCARREHDAEVDGDCGGHIHSSVINVRNVQFDVKKLYAGVRAFYPMIAVMFGWNSGDGIHRENDYYSWDFVFKMYNAERYGLMIINNDDAHFEHRYFDGTLHASEIYAREMFIKYAMRFGHMAKYYGIFRMVDAEAWIYEMCNVKENDIVYNYREGMARSWKKMMQIYEKRWKIPKHEKALMNFAIAEYIEKPRIEWWRWTVFDFLDDEFVNEWVNANEIVEVERR